MARSKAKTVKEYLEEQPVDRRKEIAKVRSVVRKNLPKGYREGMNCGMISYEIPLETYPDTYNKQPLGYASLAAHKNYNTLYLLGAYADPELRRRLEDAFDESGLRMDMGKSCLHFRKADDLPLDAIGEVIGALPPEAMIARYEAARKKR